MSCRIDCIKWFLLIFNFIWASLGVAVLAVGIHIAVILKEPSGVREATTTTLSTGFIVLGLVIIVIASCGCYCAVRESYRMVLYSVLLLVIFVIQVAFGIWAFGIERPYTKNTLRGYSDYSDHLLKTLFDDYWTDEWDRDVLSDVQLTWSCCGISGPGDYFDKYKNKTLPRSCCQHPNKGIAIHLPMSNVTCTLDRAFKNGCSNPVIAIFHEAATIGMGVSFGLAAVELVGMVFAVCLANSIRNNHRRGHGV